MYINIWGDMTMILQYDAIYLPEGASKPPGEIINQPEFAISVKCDPEAG